MKRIAFALPVLICFSVSVSIYSQACTLKVWPDGVPGEIKAAGYMEKTFAAEDGTSRISTVTDPLIEVYLPHEDKANGTAVVICPGGGYSRLAIGHEGRDVAQWLNGCGVAGIVLRYRLPGPEIMKDQSIGPLQDAQEAIRIVRRNAGNWGIDPGKIGIMGFSAGGHLASTLSTHFNEKVYESDEISARPDFSILIYAVITMDKTHTHYGSRLNLLGENPSSGLVDHFSNQKQVTENTPPAFMVHSWDDRTVNPVNSIGYARALNQYGIPVELHLYEHGGHGYGLGRGNGTQCNWPEACISWLNMRKLLQ